MELAGWLYTFKLRFFQVFGLQKSPQLLPIYYIWWESNRSVFRHQNLSLEDIIAKVESDLRACFCSWRHIKKTDENRLIRTQWCIPFRVLILLTWCFVFLFLFLLQLASFPGQLIGCVCVFFFPGECPVDPVLMVNVVPYRNNHYWLEEKVRFSRDLMTENRPEYQYKQNWL